MKATRILSQADFKLVEIMIFAVIIVLLAAIVSPNFVSAGSTVRVKPSVNSPDKTAAIAARFALESNRKAQCLINYPNDLAPYLRLSLAGSIPNFPAGDIYGKGAVSALPTCSLGDLATASPLRP
jgi:competence protein ComGC